jgi:hypothetical protein
MKKYKDFNYHTTDYTVNDMDVTPNTVCCFMSGVFFISIMFTCMIFILQGQALPSGLKIAAAAVSSIFTMAISGRLIIMTYLINRHTVTGYRIVKNDDGRFIIMAKDGLGSWRSVETSGFSFKWKGDVYGFNDYDEAVKKLKCLSSSFPIQPNLWKAFCKKGLNGLFRRTRIGKGTTVIEFTNENDLK